MSEFPSRIVMDRGGVARPPELGHQRIRLRLLILLRWLALTGQAVTVITVTVIFGLNEQLSWAALLVIFSALVNAAVAVSGNPSEELTDNQLVVHLVVDTGQLSLLLAVAGGFQNPFSILLMVPVVMAFSAAPWRHALWVAAWTVFCTIALWFVQMPLPWEQENSFRLPGLYQFAMAVACLTGAGFMSVFAWRSATETRRMSAALTATEAILAREQQLSALGGLAAAAAHELGTPLGTIYIAAKEMERFLPRGTALHDDASLLASQADRCRDILRQLSQRRHQGDPVHAQLSLRDLLHEVVEPLAEIGPRIEVVLEGGEDASKHSEGPQLQRIPELLYAINNYVENAISYAQTHIVVTGRWTKTDLEIEVRDDGPGFSPDVLKRLGEPYITDRPEGETGLGLGFFIAKSFVERHDGMVSFGNSLGSVSGAIVRARWPLSTLQNV